MNKRSKKFMTEKQFTYREEMYADWYQCPICKDNEVFIGANYCPNCGTRLIWSKIPEAKEYIKALPKIKTK